MVALTYQTWDLPMQLNRALFERGGGLGYVLKPREMRGGVPAPPPLPPLPPTAPPSVRRGRRPVTSWRASR